ncbi:hypothetical protein GCM10020218_097070 [Dactylosporangium vinaceum]|uniref:Histidine kinase n=1 Tax=Dactylosporangium vinaceum TaxID=53362 RepID=A0ABV5M2S7_9ACTN|nr:histidine kinase [Dactylosporangium vinaceum]
MPLSSLVRGLGAAALTGAVIRRLEMSMAATTAAQRAAAASERARPARELHDSVAKTLHGISFAAPALPASLRRQPDLAAQLALTVSAGADTAVRAPAMPVGARRKQVDR